MKRILSMLATAAFVASVATGAFAMDSMKGDSMKGGATKSTYLTCPRGQWVKAYKKKDGTKVTGYCRKSDKSTMMKK